MGATRPSLLALLALALALAGCGGGGEETQTSTPATTVQSGKTAPAQSAPQIPKEAKRSKQEAGANEKGSGGEGEGSRANAAPLHVSGGGSAQFEVKGGDNSVQEYGEEAEGSELREAAELVHSFYVARIAEEWGKACSYLSRHTVEDFEQLAAQAPQLKGKGCAQILAALSKPLSAALQRDATAVDAAALRQEGEQGFLIYTGLPGKTVYSMPLDLEGGEWKVGALMGSVLPR